MKTIKQWLNELPEPIRSRALKYENGYYSSNWENEEYSLSVALWSAFPFSETDESRMYWVKVSVGQYEEAESLLDTRTENSREAHATVNKDKHYTIILYTLFNNEGLTKDEIAQNSILNSEQVHKRMSELERAGKVKPNGKRKGMSGRNQTIWKAI